jgi:hypothetical protein
MSGSGTGPLSLDLQLGRVILCCFLTELDSRIRESHYPKKQWSPGQTLIPGGGGRVTSKPLVDPENPSCHFILSRALVTIDGVWISI